MYEKSLDDVLQLWKDYWPILILVIVGLKVIGLWLSRWQNQEFSDVIVSSKSEADYFYQKTIRNVLGERPNDFAPEMRREIYRHKNGRVCAKCKRKTRNAPKGFWQNFLYFLSYFKPLASLWRGRMVNIDHVIPASYNGPNDFDNGRVLCKRCNLKRSNKIDRDCLLEVRRRGKKIYLGR